MPLLELDQTPNIPTDLNTSVSSSTSAMSETTTTTASQELYNCEGLTIGPFENRFKILHTIGGGSFGHIFIAENCLGETVAVKGELQGTGYEKLLKEGNFLMKLQGKPGIPRVYWYGMHGNRYNFLVMDKCGKSLQDLAFLCGGKLSFKTVISLTASILDAIKGVHDSDIIHRDISPGNFLIGMPDDPRKLVLIDFGLAKPCHSNGQIRMPVRGSFGFRYHKAVAGTPNYISLGVHNGLPEGRRDDIESIAYMLIYLLKGELPWSHVHASSKDEALVEIGKLKATAELAKLADGIPVEFIVLLDYARKLKPGDIPDYEGLKVMFSSLAGKLGINIDSECYDWEESSQDGEMMDSECFIKSAECVLPLTNIEGLV